MVPVEPGSWGITVDCDNLNQLVTSSVVAMPSMVSLLRKIRMVSGACYVAIDLSNALFFSQSEKKI